MVLLSNYNIELKSDFYDIILVEHLLKPEKHSYEIDFMSIDYCQCNMKFDAKIESKTQQKQHSFMFSL